MLRCAWSPDGSKVAAGSSDRFVYVWDTTSRRILYKLPGHNGSVNDLDFHPKEPISKLYFLSCPHNPINLIFQFSPHLVTRRFTWEKSIKFADCMMGNLSAECNYIFNIN
jgi:WD40 repeat protein